MSTHTPGPWRPVAIAGGWDGVAEERSPESLICKLSLNNPANALLIAAAPELLAALKSARSRLHDLLDYGPVGEQVTKFCDAAIAKAEG